MGNYQIYEYDADGNIISITSCQATPTPTIKETPTPADTIPGEGLTQHGHAVIITEQPTHAQRVEFVLEETPTPEPKPAPGKYTIGACEYDILEDGTATFRKYGGRGEELIIADTIEGVPVVGIQKKACYGRSTLKRIVIPESVTSIGTKAFSGCSSLEEITIPNNVTVIEEGTFSSCRSLTSITIHGGVKSIGDYAFESCTSLSEIIISDGVERIGDYAFSECAMTEIKIPESVTEVGLNPFYCCDNLKKIIPTGNSSLQEKDGIFIDKANQKLICYLTTKKGKSYTVPKDIKEVGGNAFSYCTSLTSIKIPEGVTTIGRHAFWGCSSLKEITIPGSVTEIGEEIFGACPSPKVTTVKNSYAASYCKEYYKNYGGCSPNVVEKNR